MSKDQRGNHLGGLQAVEEVSPAVGLCLELLDDILSLKGVDCGGVYLARKSDGALVLVAHRGLSREFRNAVEIIGADSPMAQVMCGEVPYYIKAEHSNFQMQERYRAERMRSIAVIPIRSDSGVIGSLNLASRTLESLPSELRSAVETRAARYGCALSRLVSSVYPVAQPGVKAPQAEVVMTLDVKGRIVEVDSTFRDAFAGVCDTPIGMHAWRLIGMKGSWKRVHEKLLHPPYRCTFVTETTLASGARWFLWDCRAVQDGTNEVSGFHLAGRDITEMLTDGERLFAVLGAMDNASSAVFLLDEDLNVLYMNRKAWACLHGLNGSRVVLPARLDGLFPSLSDSAREEIHQAVLQGEMPSEIVYRSPEGGERKMVFVSTNVFTGRHTGVSYLVVGRIVEGNRCADGRDSEEQVYASIGRLASRILHEVKTPLTSVSLIVDLLSLELAGDERCAEPLRIIRSEIQRLRRIVKYGLESGTEAYIPVRVDLREVIEEAVSTLRVQLLERNITFRNIVEAVPIRADRQMAASAVRNLLTNAVEAIGHGGSITVLARNGESPGTVECDIIDDGCGVTDPAALFKTFRSTKPNGTGLGLVHARRICELHGGDLKLTESRPGRTVFTMVLPSPREGE